MPNTTARALAHLAQCRRSRVLLIAALVLLIGSTSNQGVAAASSSMHDAGRSTGTHHAASPDVATPVQEHPLSSCVIGSWLHSWEEDTPGIIVYRPADYPFGPSRGRDGYEFLADGELFYHGFGPADGPLTSSGRWEWTSAAQIRVTVNDPQGAYIDETLRIVSCDTEVLQVERVLNSDV
jgi:hypothetical protein